MTDSYRAHIVGLKSEIGGSLIPVYQSRCLCHCLFLSLPKVTDWGPRFNIPTDKGKRGGPNLPQKDIRISQLTQPRRITDLGFIFLAWLGLDDTVGMLPTCARIICNLFWTDRLDSLSTDIYYNAPVCWFIREVKKKSFADYQISIAYLRSWRLNSC